MPAVVATITATLKLPYGAITSPPDGETVGVAQTVGVRFDESISDRQAAQDSIKITANPSVKGAFYWISDREVRWRPENFWKPGTKVSVKADIFGIDLGMRDVGSGAGLLSIGISVIAVILAVLSLVVDFDSVERGIAF